MVNFLKFTDSEKSRVFFVSDLHHRHNPAWEIPLWKQRGYNSSEEHDAAIVSNWNNVVSPNDVVFALGDLVVGAGDKSPEAFNYLLDTLNYSDLYLMAGNHWAYYRALFNNTIGQMKIDEYYRLYVFRGDYGKKVWLIPNYYEIYVGGMHFVLSHYAILSWRDQGAGAIHLFGHSHDNLKKTPWIQENYLTGKCLDISYDSFKRPLSFSEIKQIMTAKNILKVDHHHE